MYNYKTLLIGFTCTSSSQLHRLPYPVHSRQTSVHSILATTMNSNPNKRRRFPDNRRGRGGRGGRGDRGGNNRHQSNNQHPRRPPPPDTSPIAEIGAAGADTLSVAVLGCCHGELEAVYNRIESHEKATDQKIELLVCCGDFQGLRTWADFHSLAVPPKYRTSLGTFLPYYRGEKRAPVLTIVIGGNHEASQAMQELYYGGWLAPQIYYLGAAGVVRFRGLRIGGVSGIFKGYNYRKPHWERAPYDPSSSLRSIYHVRHVDVTRMQSLSQEGGLDSDASLSQQRLDIMLSHDWPRGIEHHGDLQGLLRKKPFFREDIRNNQLGNPAYRDLLDHLKPRWWFSAHLHVKFQATVPHGKLDSQSPSARAASAQDQLTPSQVIKSDQDQHITKFLASESRDPCQPPDLTEQMTNFLALDKCLPRRPYLSIVHSPITTTKPESDEEAQLEYDAEWLAILRKTHDWTSSNVGRPVTVSKEEMEEVRQRLGSLVIPSNFTTTVAPPPLSVMNDRVPNPLPYPLGQMGNPQTDELLRLLGLDHCRSGLTVPYAMEPGGNVVVDGNEIDLDEDEEDPNAIIIDRDGEEAVEDSNEIDLDGEEE
jgi:lariat debranching enzyme